MKKILYSLVAFVLSCSSVCDAQNVADCNGIRESGTATEGCLTSHASSSLVQEFNSDSSVPPTMDVQTTFTNLCDACGCDQSVVTYCTNHATTDPNNVSWPARINPSIAYDNDPTQNIAKSQLAGCLAGAFWKCPNPNKPGQVAALPPAGFQINL